MQHTSLVLDTFLLSIPFIPQNTTLSILKLTFLVAQLFISGAIIHFFLHWKGFWKHRYIVNFLHDFIEISISYIYVPIPLGTTLVSFRSSRPIFPVHYPSKGQHTYKSPEKGGEKREIVGGYKRSLWRWRRFILMRI